MWGWHEVREVVGPDCVGSYQLLWGLFSSSDHRGEGGKGNLSLLSQEKGAHITILIVPPASLVLVGGRVEEVAESGCDRDSLRLRVRWNCDGLRACL